jgi:chorismate mutase
MEQVEAERLDGIGPEPELAQLRERIDALDHELVQLMVARCRLASVAGQSKRSVGLSLVDPPREAAVVRRAAAQAREAGLDEEVIRKVFWWLIELARRSQGVGTPGATP